MAIKTYSNSPYHDDFATTDKNYVRILFRPGRSVQVRELNQLQSNLQDQIDKFGRHIFKDGDRVLNGYTTYEPNIQSIPVSFVGGATATQVQLDALKGIQINKDSTNIKAKVLGAQAFVGANSVKYYRLYIKYSGSNDTASAAFSAGDSILLSSDEDSVTLGTNTTVSAGSALATVQTVAASLEAPGYYGGFFQDEGVFFVKGCFVYTDAQETFAYKATSTTKISGSAVFDIEETIVDYTSDATLLDNASGAPNENAPGADRYKLALDLKFISDDTTAVVENQQQVKLLEITEDNVKTPVRTEYSELAKALAQRTEEESGSYIVKPFKIDVREYLNDEAGNRGKYTADEIYNSGGDPLIPGVTNTNDAESEGAKRLVVGIEPSVAYVNGYRVELLDKQENVILKGRESGDIQTEVGHQFQTVRPTQYIEGGIEDHASDGLKIADITGMDFSPDHEYSLFNSANTLIGTCKIHSVVATGVKTFSTADPVAEDATTRVYIYDIRLNASQKLSDAIRLGLTPDDTAVTAGDPYLENHDGFTLLGDSNTTPATGIYDLPFEAINSVDDTTLKYSVEKTFDYIAGDWSNNVITLTTSDGIFTSTNPNDYLLLHVGQDVGMSIGQGVVQSVEILSGATSVKLTCIEADGTVIAANPGAVRAPVQVTGGVRTKTQTTGQVDTFTTTMIKGQVFELTKADAYVIESITHSTNPDGASVDIKSDFELDDGQRATHYALSSVQYKGNKNLSSGTLTVTYSYYAHSSGGSVFTRDSYTTNGTTKVALENIPKYAGRRLSNALDFRPVVGTVDFDGLNIRANSIVTVDFDYYLPRIDLVTLTQLADVTVTSGKASSKPIPPTLPKDSILLYTIYKPGYIYDLNDLDITNNDQRRYTMEDIGDLDQRVKNLEYYASLSALEREAAGKNLQDASGERFKNGIFTDSFIGHGAGDTTNPAYRVAIDNEEPSCRPMYLSENSRWSYVSGLSSSPTGSVSTWNGESVPSTTIKYSGKRKNAVTLDFIEKTLETQPYATGHISVNPYDVATWTGTLEVSPSSDEWKDVTHAPDIIINQEGNNDAILNQVAANPNLLGTEWNEWTTNWVGRRRTRWFGRGSRSIWTRGRDQFWQRSSRDRRRWNLMERQTREGIQTSLVENFERETIDEKVLNTSFIPFIRSRKIYFKARLLKPNTQFYVYFDDVNITSYATDNDSFVQFGGNEASAVGSTDLTNSVERYDGQTSISGADGSIVTDGSGDVDGWIVIPNNDLLRFRTGTRQIRLTDNVNNNKILETSAAETSYFAQGLLETRQRTILSTRQLAIERTRVVDSRNQLIRTVRRDPVAQTFMIGNEPTGIFLSSVDIYFQNHDPLIPIELSIVTVENGIPTQNTVPFSKVIKKWGDSGVTEDTNRAQNATKFMFDVPVYLQPGIEYAIVLISNSARWRVWTATVGGTNKVPIGANAEVVTKNPNLGVFLKSQNASTWTPDQNSDLKFTLHRADFDTTTNPTATFTGQCSARGELSYIDVTTAGQGYVTGAPTITLSGGGGSGATAKAYVGNGGTIDSIEVLTSGSGYTSAPTVTIGSPERITISTGSVDNGGTDGYISLVQYDNIDTESNITATDGGTLNEEETNIIKFKNGQKFTYHANGGTVMAGLSDGNTYYARTMSAPTDGGQSSAEYGYYFQVYSDAALTTRIDITGTGNDAQYILPVSNDTPVATALINTWRASTFLNIIQDMELPESTIDYVMTVRGDNSSTGSTNETLSYNVFPNETLYTGTRVTHDENSSHNATSYLDVLKLDAELSTTDSKIGPIIDLDRLSLVSFDNIINNTRELEVVDNQGEAAARYISRRFRLDNPSDTVNLYLDGYRPHESTDIEVYVKVRREDQRALPIANSLRGAGNDVNGDNWDQIHWERMSLVNGSFIPVNTNYDFTEAEYEFSTSDNFNEIAVKVVFLSSDKAYAPEIRNLRAIATI